MGYTCQLCTYSTTRKSNFERHLATHSEMTNTNVVFSNGTSNPPTNSSLGENNQNDLIKIDLRLIPNFKLFVCGPSRCGKTYFVFSLLSNIKKFSQSPPDKIVYVYGAEQVWDEWVKVVDHFIFEEEDPINKIYDLSKSNKLCVIFDDLLHSKDMYAAIAKLFAIDGRHRNMSLIFLSQRFFVNEENFRQITGNSDYYCLFKNPKNPSQINHLSYQMTPKGSDSSLLDAYKVATVRPYSYLFVNCTQTAEEDYKYLGRLFEKPDSVYCYRKAPYSTNKKMTYKAYQLFHKNFIVTTMKNPLIFPPNDPSKTNMNDEEYKKSLLQNFTKIQNLNQKENLTLRPEEKHPYQLDESNVNNSNVFYEFDDNTKEPRPFQLGTKVNNIYPQLPVTDYSTIDQSNRNNENISLPSTKSPHSNANTNNNINVPNNSTHNKRTISQTEQSESEIASDEDSNDSFYSLSSDKIEIHKTDYCTIAAKLKRKINDLLSLRDHFVLKCGKVEPIQGRDIEDTLENILVPRYNLYFKQTNKK